MMTEQLEARNPRTGRIDYRTPMTRTDELTATVQRLRKHGSHWAVAGVAHRVKALGDFRRCLAARRETMIEALTTDTGRWRESELEVDATLATLDRWMAEAPALLADPAPRPANIDFINVEQYARPYPVVGVISPWNFPLLLALIDAVPALLAGSTVLIKPSEVTPRYIEVADAALQETSELKDAMAWLVGDARLGAGLVDQVDLVCFTGSVATGRRVGERAAERFIPAFLELGGKDAAIVLEDADIERAARALAWGGMVNAGQSCMSIERVYAVETVYDQLFDALVAEVSRLALNTPDIESGEIGPVIAEAQIDILKSHLSDAIERGARVGCGGELVVGEEGGTWCRPTVLGDVDHRMKVIAEESFGPILPVMGVADEDAAIERANDTIYGLSAAVFSADTERARKVAARLEAGAISINDASLTSLVHTGEKQSFKQSGLGGSRMGPVAIRRFLRQQCYLVNPGVDDPWWFGAY